MGLENEIGLTHFNEPVAKIAVRTCVLLQTANGVGGNGYRQPGLNELLCATTSKDNSRKDFMRPDVNFDQAVQTVKFVCVQLLNELLASSLGR